MQLTTSRKALGYRRVSGKTQKDNFSLKGQGDDIGDYCGGKGISLDNMFTDVGTGLSIKQRPEFVTMIEYALDKRRGITDIAFWDLDRFTRNIEEFFTYTKPLLEADIHLHLLLDEEEFDYNSADRWYQKLVDAQKESKRISRRTKRGQRAATLEGRHIGKPPWGFTLEHDTDEKDAEGMPVLCGRLVPDKDKWEDVKTFWRMAAEGLTPMKLATSMNRLNIPAPGGGDWTDGAVRGVIKNHKYHGQMFRGINPRSRIPGPKENAPAIIIENNHDDAISFDKWKKINDDMKGRSREQGPTRVHSSPNPASGKLKCGPCRSNGYNSNLELHRQKGVVRLRCSRKKKVGGYDCGFKGAKLDCVLEAVTERLTNYFLTEDTLESVIAEVAQKSKPYLDEQETNKSGIRVRLKAAEDEIKNINAVLKRAGAKAKNLRSLIDDLEELEKEKAELEKIGEQITEASEEALIFVNDRDGIIETALNLKTYTDPADLEAMRELMYVFIEQVEIFADGHGVIYYNLPVRRTGPEDAPAKETIHFEKKKALHTPESCGLAQTTGIDRGVSRSGIEGRRFPRTRGDRPPPPFRFCTAFPVPPHTRG